MYKYDTSDTTNDSYLKKSGTSPSWDPEKEYFRPDTGIPKKGESGMRQEQIEKLKREPNENIEKLATAISDLMFDEGMHHTSVVITEERFDILRAELGVPMCRYKDSDTNEQDVPKKTPMQMETGDEIEEINAKVSDLVESIKESDQELKDIVELSAEALKEAYKDKNSAMVAAIAEIFEAVY